MWLGSEIGIISIILDTDTKKIVFVVFEFVETFPPKSTAINFPYFGEF